MTTVASSSVSQLVLFSKVIEGQLGVTSAVAGTEYFVTVRGRFNDFCGCALSFFPRRGPVMGGFGSLGRVPIAAPRSSTVDGSVGGQKFGFFNSAVYCTRVRTAKFMGSRLMKYLYQGGALTSYPI